MSADFLSRLLAFCFESKALISPVGIGVNSAGASFSVGGYSFTCSRSSSSFVSQVAGAPGFTLLSALRVLIVLIFLVIRL